MPLKKHNVVRKVIPIKEGSVIQTPAGQPMTLFDSAMLPAVTLNVEQFAFPKSFVVKKASRIAEYKKDPETGWDLKDSSGVKTKTGRYFVSLQLADGEVAQDLVDKGASLDSLKTINCVITKDIPLQKFEPDSTLLKLVKPVVMLGFGGRQVDRLVLKAEDCEMV